MSHRDVVSALRGRTIYGATALACLSAALISASPSAQSAPDPQCPPPYAGTLARHDAVHGLTVTEGTTPDPFSGEVLGVLKDGIAPGVDLIMVDLTSPTIDKAGIWQGMSGSPVYAADGSLIGAVSYGLAFGPSPIAGVTPAADMEALLDVPPTLAARHTLAQARQARTVDISTKQAAALAPGTGVSAAQLDPGLTRLPMPLLVSGGDRARLNKAARKLHMTGVHTFGGTTSSASAVPSDIVAGGNLAASVSYGDLTSAGIGTATAVCGSEVLAFGHPMLWSGPSQLTLHGADTVYIQSDPTVPGFKVANLTAPAGSITQDRLVGLHGMTGVLPETTTVSAHVTKVGGSARDGETKISVRDAIPDISAFHLLTDEDRVFDQVGVGSAKVTWTVKGLKSDGTPFSYTRRNRYASQYDLTFETIFESYEQLSRVLDNKFDHVKITDVTYTSTLDPVYRAYHMSRVERQVGGSWVSLSSRDTISIRGGSTMRLRAVLTPSDGGAQVVAPLSVKIPDVKRRTDGYLQIAGGGSIYGGGGGGKSFDQLLANLANATHNNDVVAQLNVRQRGADFRSTTSRHTDQVVSGRTFVSLRIR